ncbi:MAG: hypothetical protein O2956_07835, partial [Gemmatimonadetes bacterium]|nr:hypothetical protein [Gemmatimonadota bacterium]
DNNGSPSISGRVALRAPARGEVGLSYYGGYYNTFELEGATVDDRRWLGIAAMDAGGTIGPAEVRAEVAYATIDVPAGLVELFGDAQWGAYLDIVTPLWRPRLTGYEQAVLSAGLRFERVDYNRGTFSSTGLPIRDDVTAVVGGLSFRPSGGTVLRANYRLQSARDFLGNPASRSAGFQIGFATYF